MLALQYPHPRNQPAKLASPRKPNLLGSSGPLFSVFPQVTAEEDRKSIERQSIAGSLPNSYVPSQLFPLRFNTHHSRFTRPHFTAPIRAGLPTWPEPSEPASHSANLGSSVFTYPPSQALRVRRGYGWRNQDWQACLVCSGPRNPFFFSPLLPHGVQG